ncbi:hypothetical protein OZN62_11150 [Aurantiacibacter sp. MUD11]|uniref:hypothetical protein n=1 Tax=Aurantiacibacter sp. MUD11 TaxID=3003265 RepID=UPI0022AA9144|nr:hypothetical protein [Aurantiacibacter sp. MUD11]WAT17471.1 hypothetical protein OZN62_11150 [Aurantiacibacter sp. MUD11]
MNRLTRVLAAAPLALAIVAATPVVAQDEPIEPRNTRGLPEELQAIDDILVGGLLNDPTRLDWDFYGPLDRETITDASIPGGGVAMRYDMRERGQAYIGGANIPLLARVREGERITLGFYARTVSAVTDDNKGKVRIRFQVDREPYPGFGDTVLDIGEEWAWYEVTTIADRDLRRYGIVAMQFGMARQTIEIGQAIVVTGTPTIIG